MENTSRVICQNEIYTRRFLKVLRTCRPLNHTCKVVTRTRILTDKSLTLALKLHKNRSWSYLVRYRSALLLSSARWFDVRFFVGSYEQLSSHSRKGPGKVKLVTCGEHLWRCLHDMKSVRMHSFKVISSCKRAFTCFWNGEGAPPKLSVCLWYWILLFRAFHKFVTQKTGIIQFAGLKSYETELLLYTSVLLFHHNETMYMSFLICMACDFASHQIAWHNNRNFISRLFISTTLFMV